MAVIVHYIERSPNDADNAIVNDIHGVILAIDNAVDTTDALVRARAVTVLNAAGIAVPTGYFTVNRVITTVLDAAGDIIMNAGPKVHEAIA